MATCMSGFHGACGRGNRKAYKSTTAKGRLLRVCRDRLLRLPARTRVVCARTRVRGRSAVA